MARRLAVIPCALLLAQWPARPIDLTFSTVTTPRHLSAPEAKAVAMLLDEVEKRSGIRWTMGLADRPSTIVIGRGTGPPEGYSILSSAHEVTISANDARGMLFGIGRLLREMHMRRGHITIPDDLNNTTAPKYTLRGHQLGYRPKTNSYDGWSVALWEQYIRDLAVFGTNAVELIPPRSDDARRQPAVSVASDADDGGDVAPAGRVRVGCLDLVSGAG